MLDADPSPTRASNTVNSCLARSPSPVAEDRTEHRQPGRRRYEVGGLVGETGKLFAGMLRLLVETGANPFLGCVPDPDGLREITEVGPRQGEVPLGRGDDAGSEITQLSGGPGPSAGWLLPPWPDPAHRRARSPRTSATTASVSDPPCRRTSMNGSCAVLVRTAGASRLRPRRDGLLPFRPHTLRRRCRSLTDEIQPEPSEPMREIPTHQSSSSARHAHSLRSSLLGRESDRHTVPSFASESLRLRGRRTPTSIHSQPCLSSVFLRALTSRWSVRYARVRAGRPERC